MSDENNTNPKLGEPEVSKVEKSASVGRPTLYKEEYVEQILKYFDIEPYEERLISVATAKGDVVQIEKDVANDFPSLAGFAVKIGVDKDTLLEWSKVKNEDGSLKHPEFSVAYKRAKGFQEKYLTINGLKGLVNTPFGIFVAKNVLGWRDRQPDEVETVINNNNSVSNISNEDLDKKIQEKMNKLGVEK